MNKNPSSYIPKKSKNGYHCSHKHALITIERWLLEPIGHELVMRCVRCGDVTTFVNPVADTLEFAT